ncbi:MAG: hypothetical protein ACFFB3_08930 [Candidatus Hodarchaeota archaeon]
MTFAPKFGSLSPNKILSHTKKFIFSTGIGDSSCRLTLANINYGLAKIHLLQDFLGQKPDATFVSAPDLTITRNERRWMNGIGYGGRYSWGDGKTPLMILDVMPNACGMLVGGLEEIPGPETLIKAVDELKEEDQVINEIPIKWDFAGSNHFVSVYEVDPLSMEAQALPKYVFVVHGGAPEFKGDNMVGKGFGLYYEESPALQDMAQVFETPFGPIRYLLDDDAKEYYDFFEYVEAFSKKRRRLAAKILFGSHISSEITNPCHQGLFSLNDINLGSQSTADPATPHRIFPLTLRADLPCYLVKGHDNLSEEVIKRLGFWKRAERLGVLEKLMKANVLPHGGGYQFTHLSSIKRVMEMGDRRYFVLDMPNEIAEKVFATPRHLQFQYRGMSIVMRCIELGLGELYARLLPRYVLKI